MDLIFNSEGVWWFFKQNSVWPFAPLFLLKNCSYHGRKDWHLQKKRQTARHACHQNAKSITILDPKKVFFGRLGICVNRHAVPIFSHFSVFKKAVFGDILGEWWLLFFLCSWKQGERRVSFFSFFCYFLMANQTAILQLRTEFAIPNAGKMGFRKPALKFLGKIKRKKNVYFPFCPLFSCVCFIASVSLFLLLTFFGICCARPATQVPFLDSRG